MFKGFKKKFNAMCEGKYAKRNLDKLHKTFDEIVKIGSDYGIELQYVVEMHIYIGDARGKSFVVAVVRLVDS